MAITAQRAPRDTDVFLHPTKGQTLDYVAPGSYSFPSEPVKMAMAPFGSLQARAPNQVAAEKPGPGPGTYDLPLHGTETKANGQERLGLASAAMKSTVKRMPWEKKGQEAKLGPGAYKIEADNFVPVLPKDLAGPVKLVKEAAPERTTPSMPLMKLRPGQQTHANPASDISCLNIRHTGERGDMVGPGSYDHKSTLLQQRCNGQAPAKSPRGGALATILSAAAQGQEPTPGPGTYEVKEERGDKAKSSSFASKSPRQPPEPERHATPGPGTYDAPGCIETAVRSACTRIGVDRGQLGGMSARGHWTQGLQGFPGPGHYGGASSIEERTLRGERKVPHGVHHPSLVTMLHEAPPANAFNSTDKRSCNKEGLAQTPAPGHYDRDGARNASMAADLRERGKIGRRGAFGSRAERFIQCRPESGAAAPDAPSALEEALGLPQPQSRAGAAFRSMTPRSRRQPSKDEAEEEAVQEKPAPGPGSYDIAPKACRTPRGVPLGCGGSRFAEVGGKLQTPGPCEYGDRRRRHVPGCAEQKSRRMQAPVEAASGEHLGPGSYEQEETGSRLLRKSFNVTHGAPLEAFLRR